MAYNHHVDCVVSADQGGMLEYWRPSGEYEKPDNVFAMKSATNLFEFKKVKWVRNITLPVALTRAGQKRPVMSDHLSNWDSVRHIQLPRPQSPRI